jgi:hypothetical protein
MAGSRSRFGVRDVGLQVDPGLGTSGIGANERERDGTTETIGILWRYFFPFFRPVRREATTIAASSFASCTKNSTSSEGTRRVSGKNSSQKADSSISSSEILNFEMNSARDRARWAAR